MRTLFVDFDGTICTDRFWRSLPAPEREVVQRTLFIENKEIVSDWMRGNYSSEDVNHFISEQTGLPYKHLWQTFVHDCQSMYVDTVILEKLRDLRSKFYLVLVTGNMDCFDRFTVPTLALDTYFDIIVNSCTERQLKSDNEGETFKKYVKGDMHNAILIEDSEKTCALFSKIGGTALPVTTEKPTVQYLSEIMMGKF